MSNDPANDLIYAILSLDSYNRGYGAGVKGLSSNGGQARIRTFTIFDTAEDPEGIAKRAGFYAIAYRNAATGEVVASFRGTDVPLLDDDQRGASDAHKGYGLAFGLPGEGSVEFNVFGQNLVLLADQARLAEQPLACRH